MTSNIISDLISNIFSNNNNQGNSLISDYQKSLASQGYSPEVVNGVRQGLNYGNPEIQQWIEQYNQGAGRKTPINIPQTQEEIQLAKNNQFNNPRLEVGGINGKSSIMEKLADGISDFSTGFTENRNNAYLPSNLTDNKFSNGEEKGFMGRLGEAFGTGARAMNRPGVKGLATGLITTALTGNPMFGFTTGLNTANASADSDVYAKALQEQGINVPTGVFNTYSASDLSSLMQPQYKRQELDMKTLQQQMINEWRKAQVENQRYRNETDRNYKENRIINDTKKIANGGNDEVNKQAYQNDLSKLTDVLSNPKYSPEDKINAIKYIRQNHSKYFKASDIKDIEKLNELIGTQGNSDLKF